MLAVYIMYYFMCYKIGDIVECIYLQKQRNSRIIVEWNSNITLSYFRYINNLFIFKIIVFKTKRISWNLEQIQEKE